MDNAQGPELEERKTKDESHRSVVKLSPSSSSENNDSILYTILYILRQILELPTTAILLGFGFIVPDLHASIKCIGMGKSFNPERDIGSLEGKVILVTGGKQLHQIQHLYTDIAKATQAWANKP